MSLTPQLPLFWATVYISPLFQALFPFIMLNHCMPLCPTPLSPPRDMTSLMIRFSFSFLVEGRGGEQYRRVNIFLRPQNSIFFEIFKFN